MCVYLAIYTSLPSTASSSRATTVQLSIVEYTDSWLAFRFLSLVLKLSTENGSYCGWLVAPATSCVLWTWRRGHVLATWIRSSSTNTLCTYLYVWDGHIDRQAFIISTIEMVEEEDNNYYIWTTSSAERRGSRARAPSCTHKHVSTNRQVQTQAKLHIKTDRHRENEANRSW